MDLLSLSTHWTTSSLLLCNSNWSQMPLSSLSLAPFLVCLLTSTAIVFILKRYDSSIKAAATTRDVLAEVVVSSNTLIKTEKWEIILVWKWNPVHSEVIMLGATIWGRHLQSGHAEQSRLSHPQSADSRRSSLKGHAVSILCPSRPDQTTQDDTSLPTAVWGRYDVTFHWVCPSEHVTSSWSSTLHYVQIHLFCT